MIKVIDNIVSVELADEIENIMLNGNFPWYFKPNTYGPGSENRKLIKNEIEVFHLDHVFYQYDLENKINSKYYEIIKKVLNTIEYKSLYRIKANFTTNLTNYKKNNHQSVHIDWENKKCKSLLYYVNDSDGDTRFFDNNKKVIKKIKPKKGRAVLFNSNLTHAAANPIKFPYRMVINFLFEK